MVLWIVFQIQILHVLRVDDPSLFIHSLNCISSNVEIINQLIN